MNGQSTTATRDRLGALLSHRSAAVAGRRLGATLCAAIARSEAGGTTQRARRWRLPSISAIRASVQCAGRATLASISSAAGTTSAFAAANIFARASGYVDKRNVDIGDRVKAGQLLAEITAPELDHQIAQAEATLAQLDADAAATQGEPRAGAGHMGSRQAAGRSRAGCTQQQGTIDQQTLQAQEAAVRVAQQQHRGAGSAAQASSTSRRSIRASSRRSTASSPSATSMSAAWCRPTRPAGTFMFTLMQTQRDPHPGLCAAGPGLRRAARASRRSCTSRRCPIAPFPAR